MLAPGCFVSGLGGGEFLVTFAQFAGVHRVTDKGHDLGFDPSDRPWPEMYSLRKFACTLKPIDVHATPRDAYRLQVGVSKDFVTSAHVCLQTYRRMLHVWIGKSAIASYNIWSHVIVMIDESEISSGVQGGEFTSSEVCRALDLPRSTFDAWMLRGYMSFPPGPGTGRARLFDWDAVRRLAVTKALVDTHVPPSQAALWAMMVMLRVQNQNIQTVTFWTFYGGSGAMTLDDDVVRAEEGEPWASVKIYIASIFREVRETLSNRQAAPDGEAPKLTVHAHRGSRKAAAPKE